jgi:glycosyltransferase involved in cell wall biosynthesis
MFTLVTSSKFFFLGLAEELNRRGLLESLVIGYPKFKLQNLSIPDSKLRTYPYLHSLIVKFPRLLNCLPNKLRNEIRLLNIQLISKFAKRVSPKDSTFIAISSLGLELFEQTSNAVAQNVVICRASRHILDQHRILSDASIKWNITTELPSSKIISRELREYEKATTIIVPSKICKESFIRFGIDSGKVHVVYFPSNLSDFRPQKQYFREEVVITFVGQVTLRKGICTLLEGLGKLSSIEYTVNLVGPIDSKFVTYLKRLQYDRKQITFHGHQKPAKVREILSRTSIFVMPSIEEGWPMAMMEAISMGCIPLISDAICHLDELPIPDPAFIFESENSSDLASKIRNLMQNYDHYQEVLQAARDADGMKRTWVNFVDDVLEVIA